MASLAASLLLSISTAEEKCPVFNDTIDSRRYNALKCRYLDFYEKDLHLREEMII